MIKLSHFIIIYIIIFASCSNSEYNIANEQKIVINGHLSSTEPATIYLTQSANVGTSIKTVDFISDANVWLLENNIPIAQMTHQYIGKYTCSYIPKPYNTYTIQATSPTMPSAKGSVLIPEKITMKNFSHQIKWEYIDTIVYYQDYPPTIIKDTTLIINVSFKFQDFPEFGNKYRLTIRSEKEYVLMNETINKKTLCSINQWEFVPQFQYYYNQYISRYYNIFTDSLNNNKEFNFEFPYYCYEDEKYPLKLFIYWEHITQETFNYYEAIRAYGIAKTNVDQLWSNNQTSIDYLKNDDVPNHVPFILENPIEGGYGFISAGSGMVDSINIMKKPPY